MNVKEKSTNSNSHYIIIAFVIVLAFYCSSCFGGKAADNNSTDRTVERIETTAAGAADNIADAAGRNNTAQKAIGRADAELENSQRAAAESAERIDRIQSLVNECIRRNQESISLMQRIESAAPAGEK